MEETISEIVERLEMTALAFRPTGHLITCRLHLLRHGATGGDDKQCDKTESTHIRRLSLELHESGDIHLTVVITDIQEINAVFKL